MHFEKFSFGSVQIDGTACEHDVVIDRGGVRKRKKKPSKQFGEQFGRARCPLSSRSAPVPTAKSDRQVGCTVIGHLTLHLNAA